MKFLALLCWLLPLALGAAETVFVPYDPERPPAEQHPDHLYLPYEQFLTLWEAAKTARAAMGSAPAPVEASLSSARYEAQLEERSVVVTGRLDLFTGKAGMHVPLAFSGAKISSLLLDGAPAALTEDTVWVEKPGRHTLEVRYEVPREPGAKAIAWGIPESTATLLALTLPQAQQTAEIAPGGGAVEQLAGGVRTVTAALGRTAKISLALHTAAAPVKLAQPALASIQEQIRVGENEEVTVARVDFAFTGATQQSFTVDFDAGAELVDLNVPGLQAWKLRPEGARQTLELQLAAPVHDALTVRLTLRRAGPEGPAPLVSAVALRVEQAERMLVGALAREVTAAPGAGLRQIPATQPVPPGYRSVAAFAGAGELSYRLAPAAARREARVDYLYQVGRRQVELFASLQLFAKGDPSLHVALDLPAGFTVESVQSERPHEWWREGDRLWLRFLTETPESTPLVLYLVRREATAPSSLAVQPLRLPGFRKVSGEAVIAAHKGVEVALQLSGAAREMPAEKAAPDFQVLPPLERKRGIAFTEQGFAGAVQLQALPARLLATWAAYAEAHESWIALSTKVRLTVRQGSVDHARFSLPAALPEARVTGPELRETRSRIEGDRRLYDLDFQNDVFDEVEFALDLEVPHTGTAALPAPVFPEAERSNGWLVVENGSAGEMSIAQSGLEPALAAELPWPLTRPGSARLFRAPAGAWSAALTIERLEKAAGRLAFCPWADLTTALRFDGTEWHRAVWHLQNRALQFLPVRLPAGAELVSARVAGQNVRVDAATLEGAPAILIPLIKTKPGELSYDVEAVYRIAGPPLPRGRDHSLRDPALVGITVERTFWNLFLPGGYRARKVEGNMEVVLDKVATADKLDDALKELQMLGSLALSTSNGRATRAAAFSSFERLRQSIATGNESQSLADRETPSPRQAGRAEERRDRDQRTYVERKQAEVAQALNTEAQRLAETGKDLTKSKTEEAAKADSSQAAARQVWAMQTAPPIPGAPPAGAANANSGQLFLNDNIVLNRGAQAANVPGLSVAGPSPVKGLPVAPGVEADVMHYQANVLNTARGNKAARQEYEPPQIPQQVIVETRSGATEALPAKPAARGDQPVPAPADHRTTLALDFPTEGEALHFKKLKNAATLEISLEPAEPDHRLLHTLLLLPAAAALALLQSRRKRAV